MGPKLGLVWLFSDIFAATRPHWRPSTKRPKKRLLNKTNGDGSSSSFSSFCWFWCQMHQDIRMLDTKFKIIFLPILSKQIKSFHRSWNLSLFFWLFDFVACRRRIFFNFLVSFKFDYFSFPIVCSQKISSFFFLSLILFTFFLCFGKQTNKQTKRVNMIENCITINSTNPYWIDKPNKNIFKIKNNMNVILERRWLPNI